MISSNAVRHRSNNAPNDSHHPSTSLTVGDTISSNDKDKLHGGRFRRPRELGSKKQICVLVAALSLFALCVVGMWAFSNSIDGGHGIRQIDQRAPPTRLVKKKGTKKQRPSGVGHRKDEDFFPIHQSNDQEDVYTRHEIKVDDETRNEEYLIGKSPEEENVVAQEVESGGSHKNKHDKISKDDNDDEDRANDLDKEAGVDEKEGEGESAVSAERPLKEVDAKSSFGYQRRPRVVRLHFGKNSIDKRSIDDSDKKGSGSGDNDTREDGKPNTISHKNVILTEVHRLPTHESQDAESSERYITPWPDDDEYVDRVENVKKSKKYRRNEREPLETKECKPRYDWQAGAFPNCNILHEFELGQLSGMYGRAVREKLRKPEGDGEELVKYLAHGYWRDVWLVSKAAGAFDSSYKDASSALDEEITVLKTLRYKHDFTDRNYDRHRKDALASERLSNSPNVVDIFAYCSNSAIFEYGHGGDIEGKLWPYDKEEEKYYVADIPSSEKLDMAYQVADGIADMHDVEDDNIASIAHTDITPSQFIFINGRWKMNDFNRCRFMRVYKNDNSPCGFKVGANPGKFRSPEEYSYEEENEMIDVYSMGNIFYAIIAGEMPFEGQKESKAQKKVMEGKRPIIPSEVLESDDIAIQALVSATKKCWAQKPGDRPSAASIRDEFKKVMDRIKGENVTKDS
ncbi:hypothetical protein ACHAXR_011293 [Thalassiosira sp. AJA248-18]